MSAILEFPTIKHKEMYQAFKAEILAHDGGTMINGDGGCHEYESYEAWLEYAKDLNLGINLKEGYVPATTYFLIEDDQMIGTINIRHRLNEYLYHAGGHIGYSILPSKRRQGYASAMLIMALLKCKDLGIEPVLITCDKNNIASRKTIERCGGILENEYYDENNDKTVLRFWINHL